MYKIIRACCNSRCIIKLFHTLIILNAALRIHVHRPRTFALSQAHCDASWHILQDLRNTSARSTSLLMLLPFLSFFVLTKIECDSFSRTIYSLFTKRTADSRSIFRKTRGFITSRGNRTLESISSSGQIRRLSAMEKLQQTVRAFRVPDNYGHRSVRLRLRSVSLQNHRSARLTKGSETVLSVLDLKAIKVH